MARVVAHVDFYDNQTRNILLWGSMKTIPYVDRQFVSYNIYTAFNYRNAA